MLILIVLCVVFGIGFGCGEMAAAVKGTVALTAPMIEKILRKHQDKDGEFFFGPCAEEIAKRLKFKK